MDYQERRAMQKEFIEFLSTLENFTQEYDKDDRDQVFELYEVNFDPFTGLDISLMKIDGKLAIVFDSPRYTTNDPTPLVKVYYPEIVETALIESNRRKMVTYRIDNRFWFYREVITSWIHTVIMSFGMDMTMPFLDQQKFEMLNIP